MPARGSSAPNSSQERAPRSIGAGIALDTFVASRRALNSDQAAVLLASITLMSFLVSGTLIQCCDGNATELEELSQTRMQRERAAPK